jgi:hypothetical protein
MVRVTAKVEGYERDQLVLSLDALDGSPTILESIGDVTTVQIDPIQASPPPLISGFVNFHTFTSAVAWYCLLGETSGCSAGGLIARSLKHDL